VAIAAEYRQKQLAAWEASAAFTEAKGTPREIDALCRALRSQEALEEYKGKLERLRELQAELRRSKAGRSPGTGE
jgi:hypothetical protein